MENLFESKMDYEIFKKLPLCKNDKMLFLKHLIDIESCKTDEEKKAMTKAKIDELKKLPAEKKT